MTEKFIHAEHCDICGNTCQNLLDVRERADLLYWALQEAKLYLDKDAPVQVYDLISKTLTRYSDKR